MYMDVVFLFIWKDKWQPEDGPEPRDVSPNQLAEVWSIIYCNAWCQASESCQTMAGLFCSIVRGDLWLIDTSELIDDGKIQRHVFSTYLAMYNFMRIF